MSKIKLGLIFGGRSGEHEVSLISAWNIFQGLDKSKYEIQLIGIDKDGAWHWGKDEKIWLNPQNPKTVKLNKKTTLAGAVKKKNDVCLIDLRDGKTISKIDVFFPITHGTYGEDGCLQGFLETIGAPYVGPGVLGSAVSMDKDVSKRLLRDAGFKQSKFIVLREKPEEKQLAKIIKDLKLPIFVKPARQGSSVGISKAKNKAELAAAITEAFKFDTKVVLEQMIVGREIECAILGNLNPIASQLGEIKLSSGFYSYDAKYIDENVAQPVVGVKLPAAITKKIQQAAIAVYKTLECEGLSRVDFFLTKDHEIYVNEINTLPGFTSISMYPKLLEASGIKYKDLLDKLITFGLKKKK